jgi:type III secretion system FlhB-like substrate exporter
MNEENVRENINDDEMKANRGLSPALERFAEGLGESARKRLQDALEHNFQDLQDGEILSRLKNSDLLEEIPPEMIPAVEEILNYLNKMDLQKGKDSP